MSDPVRILRAALTGIDVAETSWVAAEEPSPEQIFAPEDHDGALDPDRAIVVGNRGVGKSFWSAVLSHATPRLAVSAFYPRLRLDRTEVRLGFHERAADGLENGPAPSRAHFLDLENRLTITPLNIWRSVLLQSLQLTGVPVQGPNLTGWDALAGWVTREPLAFETALRGADDWFHRHNKKFVLLFDALDRVGDTWTQIRPRTEAALRLALHLRSSKALRIKLFLRSDQFADRTMFMFPDASKLRQEAVSLVWRRRDLYGLLYRRLWTAPDTRAALLSLLDRADRRILPKEEDFPASLAEDEELQARIFYRLAGEFMGAGPTKGRTWSWLHDHLADAAGETSPRSFLVAIKNAAAAAQGEAQVLGYKDLHTGVQDASRIRLDQLKEDYAWIERAIDDLENLVVPTEQQDITGRWAERDTVRKIRHEAEASMHGKALPPVLLADNPPDPEAKLLEELIHINVLERRTNGKINMPDIFRVAARIKRKGGLRPPPPPGRR